MDVFFAFGCVRVWDSGIQRDALVRDSPELYPQQCPLHDANSKGETEGTRPCTNRTLPFNVGISPWWNGRHYTDRASRTTATGRLVLWIPTSVALPTTGSYVEPWT